MIMIVVLTIRTLAALAFEPIPAHARAHQTDRPASGKTIRGTAEAGERGDRSNSTPDGTPSPVTHPSFRGIAPTPQTAFPEAERLTGWYPAAEHRVELDDAHLAYRLAVWTEEASR